MGQLGDVSSFSLSLVTAAAVSGAHRRGAVDPLMDMMNMMIMKMKMMKMRMMKILLIMTKMITSYLCPSCYDLVTIFFLSHPLHSLTQRSCLPQKEIPRQSLTKYEESV